MNDKDLLEDILMTVKGGSDLYLHGSIESATPNVHSAFDNALSSSLKVQNEIYKKMSQKGWYPSEQAEQNKINQAKQKFATQQ